MCVCVRARYLILLILQLFSSFVLFVAAQWLREQPAVEFHLNPPAALAGHEASIAVKVQSVGALRILAERRQCSVQGPLVDAGLHPLEKNRMGASVDGL